MFKVIKNGTNRLDIEMSGKLDAESMKVALRLKGSEPFTGYFKGV